MFIAQVTGVWREKNGENTKQLNFVVSKLELADFCFKKVNISSSKLEKKNHGRYSPAFYPTETTHAGKTPCLAVP
jgi:hypothetical protein